MKRNLPALFRCMSYASFLVLLLIGIGVQAQQAPTKLGIKNFAIFGGDSLASHTDSLRYGVELASNIGIQGGGAVGSYTFLKMNNSVTISGDIYVNTFQAGHTNTFNGTVTVSNTDGETYNVLNAGFLSKFTNPGNIIINGNSFIDTPTSAPSVVDGFVQYPNTYTYVGPVPAGGIFKNTPFLPTWPDMPFTGEFSVGTASVLGTQTITPGAYGVIALNGGATVTFSGVGDYYFRSIGNTGINNFVFDFQNNATGAFRLFIQDTASVGNINVTLVNGGSAARIYTETQGAGNAPNGFNAFLMNTSGTSANWEGTIWAPYGGITIGQKAAGSANQVRGCLWSATKVTLGFNTAFTYVPLSSSAEPRPNSDILPYYPPPADGKTPTLIGSELTSLFENAATLQTDSIIYRIFGDSVLIEVIALQGQYANTLSFLQTQGLRNVINNGAGSLIITGKFPIANLLSLNARTDLIDYARPLYFPINNSGIALSQGDSAMRTKAVRNAYEINGAGVKVGVISDSYNSKVEDYARIDVSNGDLPGASNPYGFTTAVDVVGEYPFGERVDEGRAMLQIVHDVAPGAALAFRTGFISAGDFAQGIGELNTAGCKIIVDDITYVTEPYFKDGVVAKAVDQAVASGVTYFSAAGNFGKKSYEGLFNGIDAPANLRALSGTVHDFGSRNPLQTLNLAPGNYTIVLQWDDAIYSLGESGSGTQTDLDIYLVDNLGSTLFGFNRINIGTDPLEVLPFTVVNPTTAQLLIAKASGPNVRFKYIVFRGDLTIDGYNGSSTLVGQANATGAIAVGAVLYTNTEPYSVPVPTIASFSSVGGALVNSSNRQKPDITAPNGVNTTVDFRSTYDDGDRFPNFFGTSAAAPHAAATAALIIEGQHKFLNHVSTPSEIRTLLQTTTTDMGAPGYDAITGYGFIQPMKAMQTFASPKPLIISFETANPIVRPVSAPFTVTITGKDLTAQTKVYFGTTELATEVVNAEHVRAVIPAFSGNPAIRLYNPPIVSNSLDGGFSESLYFFPVLKKHIVVTAADKSKQYGETLPVFTATITVDNVPIGNTTLTPTHLKLNNLTYNTPATSASNVATYFIHPVNPLIPGNPADEVLLDQYDYEFVDGLLAVTRLPLKITPRDTILTYGEKIKGLDFNYTLGASTTIQNRDSFVAAINIMHTTAIVDSIYALLNGSGSTSRALVNGDLENLGILMSNGSGSTSRALVNGGSGAVETSYVVDVATASIFNYLSNPASSPLVNGSGSTSRALVNTGPLVNGTASVLSNGSGSTSRALVNGDPTLLNSSTTGSTGITNIAVIVSQADVPAATNNSIFTKPINLITSIYTGTNTIVAGAFLSRNFEITYGLGNLKITKAPLTIKANTKFTDDGVDPRPYSAAISGYQYQDASIPKSGPSYTIIPTYTGLPGVYTIKPYGLSFSGDSNYTKSYVNGLLYVNPYGSLAKKVLLKVVCVEALYRHPSGFKYVIHFTYENRNATPVYVPVGKNNLITSAKAYGGTLPVIFKPGVNGVDIYFNGDKLTWSLITTDGISKKTASSAMASSTTTKCKATGAGVITNATENGAEETNGKLMVYPNPAITKLTVTGLQAGTEKTMVIYNSEGKTFVVPAVRKNGNQTELAIAALQKGLYFIRTRQGTSYRTIAFLKL
ncbi:MAG TPA: S8 family serine peptidase [Niastella sp.]|nr:S8 family serine peptidase [Niastella sp.]